MKRFYFHCLVLLAPLWCASCGSNPVAAPATPSISSVYQAQQTDNIREALLRSIVLSSAATYYVSFGQQDPSDAFIKRMNRLGIKIQKMSLSPRPFVRGRGPASMSRNPMIEVFPIRWINSSKVEMQVDWPGAGARYTLTQNKGKWKVSSRKRVWIS